MNQKHNDGLLVSVVALLSAAVITMATAIVLSAAPESAGRRALPNLNDQRSVTSTGSTEPSPRVAPIDDPALTRIDRSNEHHG